MKVKMLVAMDRPDTPFAVDQIVDVPEQLGVAYIQAKYAVAVEGEKHPDPNAPPPAPVVPVPVPAPTPPVRQAASKPKE